MYVFNWSPFYNNSSTERATQKEPKNQYIICFAVDAPLELLFCSKASIQTIVLRTRTGCGIELNRIQVHSIEAQSDGKKDEREKEGERGGKES